MRCTRCTSDWLGKAFTLSLIGCTSTCERAVRRSDWLYSFFSRAKIKRMDLYKFALWNKISCIINIYIVLFFFLFFVFPFYFPLPTSLKWNSWKSHFEKGEWQPPVIKDRLELENKWHSGDRENRWLSRPGLGAKNSHTKPISRHFYRLIYFYTTFSSGSVTLWRQVSFLWLVIRLLRESQSREIQSTNKSVCENGLTGI